MEVGCVKGKTPIVAVPCSNDAFARKQKVRMADRWPKVIAGSNKKAP
jgi:hypothetical protein